MQMNFLSNFYVGNVVYFMPPYVITEAETAWVLEQIRDVICSL